MTDGVDDRPKALPRAISYGRDVVRVDQTALDYLGVNSGDEVVVSWAARSTIARVLLHTDETRAWMA